MNCASRIWSPGAAAKATESFLESTGILSFARRGAERRYGISGEPRDMERQLGQLNCAHVIIASISNDAIVAWDRNEFCLLPTHEIAVVERIDAVAAMVAKVLHGWLQGDLFKSLCFGALVKALCLKHYGDTDYGAREAFEDLLDNPSPDIVR